MSADSLKLQLWSIDSANIKMGTNPLELDFASRLNL